MAPVIRTPDQRLRAFVSSTLQELAEERLAARDAILQLRLAPVLFELGARPHPAADLYRAYLDQSHIFIGIYWQKYGWVAPGETISGLEDEYRLSGSKPKLIYIKAPAPEREPRLKALLDDIKSVASYKYFATAAELRELIANDLSLLLTERFEAPAQRSLPSGTVSFLFTDIEGSTDLAQRYPEALPALLAQHHSIVQEAVAAHDGVVFQITGDAFHAAFDTAAGALQAALDAQRRLQQHAWSPAPIKVRMGIHTGAAQTAGADDPSGGYTGYSTLARTQRVTAAGHGGQVLLSNTSAEQTRAELPPGVTLRDMGEHHLKGLLEPEHLWQVVAPDLPQTFARLQTLSVIPNNLPVAMNRFVGRERELRELKDRLAQARLLTLVGPGGTGKTRLALQAAAELLDDFEDRVYLVDLAPSRDLESVLAAMARTLGLRDKSDRPLLDELEAQIGKQKMLLLLDNFEQVTEAAPTVAGLMRRCPVLKLLVTSRETLQVQGEVVMAVPPLGLPAAGARHLPVDQLAQSEAVQLFVERARAVRPGFELTNENAQAVAELVVRLDGLPLAIELATARLNLFSPAALVERLGDRLKLLRGGVRDLPERQRTLRGAIDWSYELLNRGEQRLFELLSVFAGGCSYEAVEAAAGAIPAQDGVELDVLDGLGSLAAKSLIRLVDQESGEARLRMLETIREYAAGRLEEDPGLSAAAHRAQAVYFAGFTQRQAERLAGASQAAALEALETEVENLRVAWRYWVAAADLEQLRRMTEGLWLLFEARSWYRALVNLITDLLQVLAAGPATPERVKEEISLQTNLARALIASQGLTRAVEAAYTRALELCQTHGEVPPLFPVLRGLASYHGYRGDAAEGRKFGEQILRLAEQQDDDNMRSEGHVIIGYNLLAVDQLEASLDHFDQGIALYHPERPRSGTYRLGNNPAVIGYNISALGLWMLGFPERAVKRAEAGVAFAAQLNYPWSMAYALFHTALLHAWRGDTESMRERAQATMDIAEEYELPIWHAVGACLAGAATARMGQAEAGLRQIERGMALSQSLKTPPMFWLMLNCMQSEVLLKMGQAALALAKLDETLADFKANERSALMPEILRLRGEVLLALGPARAAEAEAMFQQALEMARALKARMPELRAAMSLSRIWRAQGQPDAGRQLVREIYAQFTEGFTTADLLEAKEMCDG
jgi:predicted ATPase/class 3 adenylate cyclase